MKPEEIMKKAVEHAVEEVKKDNEKKKLIKRVPAKPEWIKIQKAGMDKIAKASALMQESQSESRKLWAVIKLDINDFDNDLKWSEDGKFIEVLESIE